MELELPSVKDLGSFTKLIESFEEDGNGDLEFKCTKFVVVDKVTHAAWVGSLDIPKKQVTMKQALGCLRRVPDSEIYPAVAPNMPQVAASGDTLAHDAWLKRPNIAVYSQVAGSTIIADELSDEIRTCQLIQANPHPNIVEFRGCLEKGGRVIGILLKRYAITLSTRVKGYSQPPFDAISLLKGIEAGLEHLHSLGLAHNDLNPEYVMLDEQGRPVIIDMGSCKPLGQKLHQGGTPDWNDGFEEVSSVANDQIGLQKVGEWLSVSCAKRNFSP